MKKGGRELIVYYSLFIVIRSSGKLVAYRLNGESILDNRNLTYVQKNYNTIQWLKITAIIQHSCNDTTTLLRMAKFLVLVYNGYTSIKLHIDGSYHVANNY